MVSFTSNDVDSVYRMGRYVEKAQQLRLLMVKLATMTQTTKENVYPLKEKEKWARTHTEDVVQCFHSVEALNQRRIHCIASLARTMGVCYQVRGSTQLVTGIRRETLADCPRMEKAKLTGVSDGLACPSHHAFLSDLSPLRISCANWSTFEHLGQSTCAEFHEKHGLSKQIRATKDPYLAKRSRL